MRSYLGRPSHRRVRWTRLELALLAAGLLLILASTAVELFRWINPLPAPAAPRASQSETAQVTPTASPSPTVGEPPLTLEQSASVASATFGQEFSYTLLVSSSRDAYHDVEVLDNIDQQLEVLGVGVSNGACSGANQLSCAVRVRRGEPSTIAIRVRVLPNAVPGSAISQAIAQDDLQITAASDQVVVALIAPSPQPTATATATPQPETNAVPQATQQIEMLPNRVEPTSAPPEPPAPHTAPAPSEAPAEPSDPVAVPAAPSEAVVPVATPDAAGPPVEAQPTTSAPIVPPDQAEPQAPALVASPGLPPTLSIPTLVPTTTPDRSRPAEQPAQGAPLPDTAAVGPSFGIAFALFGLALTLHAARRVRRADAWLAYQGARFAQLAPLLRVIADLQHTSAAELDRMQGQSKQLIELMDVKRDKQEAKHDS